MGREHDDTTRIRQTKFGPVETHIYIEDFIGLVERFVKPELITYLNIRELLYRHYPLEYALEITDKYYPTGELFGYYIPTPLIPIEGTTPNQLPPAPSSLYRQKLFDLHHEMCDQAFQLMTKKNQDYGNVTDPFKNFRRHGIQGMVVRLFDKFNRLESFANKGKFEFSEESLRDTLVDIINYAVLIGGFTSFGKEALGTINNKTIASENMIE